MVSALTVVFVTGIYVIISKSNDCVFIDDSTGYILYLDALKHETIIGADSEYIYHYTPCGNGNSCKSDESGMCIQTDNNNEEICVVIARWDDRVKPIYESDDQTWTFQYNNGDICYVTCYFAQ